MGKTLTEIAQQLHLENKKAQLIYAFNGIGKTRLSCEFKHLVSPPKREEEVESKSIKILYYNAFTEDLFHWDNDLENDTDRRLIIQPNSFTEWLLTDEGMDKQIVDNFSTYTNSKLSPEFNEDFSEIRFSLADHKEENIKISKAEESCFIWCIFLTMLKLVIEELKLKEDDRSTPKFNSLKYIFIDDPVTSLDENNLIELSEDLAEQIKNAPEQLKFIITTHNPLFYNILHNSLNAKKYTLLKLPDGTYELECSTSDSPFSYHLYLLNELKKLIDAKGEIQKYHFNFLRNIIEKTSTFLGYTRWAELFDSDKKDFISRLINISSHSKISSEESRFLKDEDKEILKSLTNQLIEKFHFKIPPS